MKKYLVLFALLLLFIPSLALAQPTITSDVRSFNPLTGVYELQGHVFVQFPAHDKTLTITGDTTHVHLYQMEVHGQGNIKLLYDQLAFACDQVDVIHKERTAYVKGSLTFTHHKTTITADSGTFNWKTKLATFTGNLSLNGQKIQGPLTYNVLTQELAP